MPFENIKPQSARDRRLAPPKITLTRKPQATMGMANFVLSKRLLLGLNPTVVSDERLRQNNLVLKVRLSVDFEHGEFLVSRAADDATKESDAFDVNLGSARSLEKITGGSFATYLGPEYDVFRDGHYLVDPYTNTTLHAEGPAWIGSFSSVMPIVRKGPKRA